VTFSYLDPSTNFRDGLRLLCGDTTPSQVLLQDEEYDFVRVQWPDERSPYILASYACEMIAAKFAREINISADSQTVGADVLQQKYLTLAERLRTIAKTAHPGEVYVGGMDSWVSYDPSVAPLAFGTQMHDNPAAGQQDYGDNRQLFGDPLVDYGR
jgi:hypothetical protein